MTLMSESLFSLSVNPSVVELNLVPGRSTNGFYTVQNNTSDKVVINVEPESYFGSPVTNWLKIMPKNITLEPGQSRDIGYKVSVPRDFKDEYIAKIYFSQTPAGSGPNPGGASIITRMGSSFYVSASGKEILRTEISNFTISDKISVDIRNNGNVHLRFYYDLEVFDEKGRELTTTDRVPFAVVIPGESKNISIPLKTEVKLVMGRYYAVLNLYYGNVMPLVNKISSLTQFEVKK